MYIIVNFTLYQFDIFTLYRFDIMLNLDKSVGRQYVYGFVCFSYNYIYKEPEIFVTL